MLPLVLYMCEHSYLVEPGNGYVASQELTGPSLLAGISSVNIPYRELQGFTSM